MLRSEAQIKNIPLQIVTSTKFGRYDKISREEVFNFIQSDGFMVDFAGFKNVDALNPNGLGRDIYSSSRGNIMVEVISDLVYVTAPGITSEFIGSLATSSGDVFMSENNHGQIVITDTVNMYVYNYTAGGFVTILGADLGFSPGYVTFQDSRIIVAALGTNTWRLSNLIAIADASNFPNDAQHVGELQTKPDLVVGALRFPGAGNLLFVFGKTVIEPWNDIGAAIFPYTRLDSYNVDYGCLSANTIAENENIVVWLAANEQSGPAIMYSTGTDTKKISTDGIDFKLSQLTNPQDSYGMLFRQDGHQIYMITFKTDNLSYIYDFNTEKFFTVCDENMNHHPAKRVVFFNNKYYFVSFNDGNLYEFGTQFTSFQYAADNIQQMPRIIIPGPMRLPSSRWFIGDNLTFIIENGQPNNVEEIIFQNTPFEGNEIETQDQLFVITTQDGHPICMQHNFNTSSIEVATEVIDLSISRDGGVTFGSAWRKNMNPTGIRKSRMIFQRLGILNDLSFMLRFHGFGRYVVGSGLISIHQ